MMKFSPPNRLSVPVTRLLLSAATFWGILAVGHAGFAAEFQAVPKMTDDVFNSFWDWTNPRSWQGPDKKPGIPKTADDVGVISAGQQIATNAPLGTAAIRPTIRVERGGVLLIGQDMLNPLTLNGGAVDGAWIGHWVKSPITVTADSTIRSRDDAFGLQLHVGGPVANSAPLTLHFQGCVGWHSNSSKTFTGNIHLDRGNLFVMNQRGSDALGSGSILLAPTTRLVLHDAIHDRVALLDNDVSGDGSIMAGDGGPWWTLSIAGAALHPGQPQRPGTMAINGSVDFQRDPAGKPAKLIIEVQGDGSALGSDYGQLAIFGNVSDTLDNVDLILQLKPDITADQAAQLHLIVLSWTTDALTKANAKPFHSVQVFAGDRKGSATAKTKLDPVTGNGVVEVSDIVVK